MKQDWKRRNPYSTHSFHTCSFYTIGFWGGSQKERDHYEDLDAGGRITLKCILEI
jgi:hypothetical protein